MSDVVIHNFVVQIERRQSVEHQGRPILWREIGVERFRMSDQEATALWCALGEIILPRQRRCTCCSVHGPYGEGT